MEEVQSMLCVLHISTLKVGNKKKRLNYKKVNGYLVI